MLFVQLIYSSFLLLLCSRSNVNFAPFSTYIKQPTCNSSNCFMVSSHVQFLSNYCIGKNLPVPCLFYSPQIVKLHTREWRSSTRGVKKGGRLSTVNYCAKFSECVTDVLSTFWCPLWFITLHSHGNMESICFIQQRSKNC